MLSQIKSGKEGILSGIYLVCAGDSEETAVARTKEYREQLGLGI